MTALHAIADVGAVDPGRPLYHFEIRSLKTAHRRVQLGEGGGTCRWCGKTIIGKRGKYIGRPDPARSWCRDDDGRSGCYLEYSLHRETARQFAWLEANRGLRCAECGAEDPRRWQKVGSVFSMKWLPPMPYAGNRPSPDSDRRAMEDYWIALDKHRAACLAYFPSWGDATAVERVTDLQVDHIIPLWLVALTVRLADRRRYFGPDNLQLLCRPCHKAKSKREAAERAEMKRALAA